MSELCNICPRQCNIDREISAGFCRACGNNNVTVSRAALHFWEEPCISGERGSGTVFFSNCNLKCVFCQNAEISVNSKGKEISCNRLADIFLELEDKGAENINLVTPTHYSYQILKALDMVKDKLDIPVVMNCGGYESVETLKMFDGYIDIYLPDLKYKSSELSGKYSSCPDYFEKASEALKEMHRQVPKLIWDRGIQDYDMKILKKGLIIRHLVLPGCYHDSLDILDWLNNCKFLTKYNFLLSLMSQFTPTEACMSFPELNRRITTFEYEKVVSRAGQYGFRGFIQERSSAQEEYIPPFDLTGVTPEQG